MSYLEFDDSLKVKNKIIDQEHAVLVEYINLLHKAIENETSDRLLGQVLEGLTDYAKTHFFVEEEMMKAFNYPDMEQHKIAHAGFKERVGEIINDFNSNKEGLSIDVMNFLKEWLTGHILKIDKKLADFLADKSFR